MPQAIFFSRLTRQRVFCWAHMAATRRIITSGPQHTTRSYCSGLSIWVTKPWKPTRPLSVATRTTPAVWR